jgi:glycosyltransferase involved in cell wall biosynthesis
MVDLSILIPTHNRGAILGQTLDSLSQIELPQGKQIELVVIGNACTDNTAEMVAEWGERLPYPCRYVEDPVANLNVARNRGAEHSTGEVLAYLDDDVWVERSWATALCDAFANPDVRLAGGKVTLWWKDVARPEWFTPQLDGLLTSIDYGPQMKVIDSPYIAGANMAVRRSLFDEIGGFMVGLDRSGSNVGLSGGDTEFILQAMKCGAKVYYVPDAAVRHWVSPHRAEPAYLFNVATANAAGRVYMKHPLSAAGYVRGLVGSTWLMAKSLPLATLASMRNDQGACMGHRIRARTGAATFRAYVRRLRGLSPVKNRTP